MPLALRFELANDEALREILERCLRQSPPERPAHGVIRDAFRLALGDGDGGSESVPGAAAVDVHGESGGASPPGHGVLGGGAGSAPDPGGGIQDQDPGAGDPGSPRDWRSLLSDSAPLPELPSWQTPAAPDPAPAIAPAAARHSLLDLFDLPATY